jgi:phosphoribosylamine--glycine ligase
MALSPEASILEAGISDQKSTDILIFGGGGREHAIAAALRQSRRAGEIVCAPGNAGSAQVARCVPVRLGELDDMLRVAAEVRPDLVVIGPELPLSLGLTDELLRRGIPVFGPTRGAALLETSKSFSKRFMQRHNIPTAAYAVVTSEAEGLAALEHFHTPLVIKADGIAAGKGVIICESLEGAQAGIAGLFSGSLLGSHGETALVIEEFLEGEEVSFLVLTDGKHIAPLAPAQDHKRIGEGDTGPNTGGMGVYSTDSILPQEMRTWVLDHIVQPTLAGLAAEGMPFVGVLYCGLMMTARGPMVLEFNARFGDPETQAILARLDAEKGADLLEAIEACVHGRLSDTELRWKPGASACVIASSAGYPGSYATGLPISGLAQAAEVPGVAVFHSGTALKGGAVVTAGGRVLGVTATGATLDEALSRAYEGLEAIHFEGMYYRRDIGHRALRKVG